MEGTRVQTAFTILTHWIVIYSRETEYKEKSKSLREEITKRRENKRNKNQQQHFLTQFLTGCVNSDLKHCQAIMLLSKMGREYTLQYPGREEGSDFFHSTVQL